MKIDSRSREMSGSLHAGVVLALVSAIGALPSCADPTCEIVSETDGSQVLRCGNEEVVFERCYDHLPDLNADGVVDNADCDLESVGVATRAICEQLTPYSELALCHAPVRQALGFIVAAASISQSGNTTQRLALLMMQRIDASGSVTLWVDGDGDGMLVPGETRGVMSSAAADQIRLGSELGSGCLSAVAWNEWQDVTPAHELIPLWRDKNCNTTVEPGETAVVVLRTPGATRIGGMLVTSTGLGFTEQRQNGDGAIIWWTDANGDLVVDPGERFVVASGPTFKGLIGLYPGGNAILYRDGGVLFTWTSSVSPPAALPPNSGYEQCDFLTQSPQSLGCVTRDGRLLDTFNEPVGTGLRFNRKRAAHAVTMTGGDPPRPEGTLSYGTGMATTVVGALEGGSTRAERHLDEADYENDGVAAIVDKQPWFLITPKNLNISSVLERWLPTRDARFLNELCAPDAPACQDGLACAVTGNAAEPRCVLLPDASE